ncbi:Two-component response regulator-like APRR1 [Sesamum angolense]|uniref:Two-component response regulator-like APRR1 n=1 Tax=Sesamum angolense TaxID=2727404 RepID=A0AAE1WM43_9LAMI|nr:Two-component response regulator-like APRR1 [Sesamum angolense]
MEKSEIVKSSDGFIDRSRVRILLCDNDERSSEEVFKLLCKCSYQVTSVKSPRQVIDALNAEGPDIDIILSELGLAEKNIVNYDFDPVASDPSDANTNSTTLFSDDTDDKSRRNTNPETCASTHQENETNATTTAAPIETATGAPSECQPDVLGLCDRQRGQISLFPKKSELKIGESSAFFTYVKSSIPKSNNQGKSSVHENAPQNEKFIQNVNMVSCEVGADVRGRENRKSLENHSQADDYTRSNSVPNSFSMERSCTPPVSLDISQQRHSKEFSHAHLRLRNDSPNDVAGCYPHAAYPYYMPGVMNQVTMQSASMYQKNLPDMLNHVNSAVMPQYSHIPQCPPHVPGMASYPYYPFGICLQPGQMAAPHPWPSYGNSSNEGKLSKVDRREAALMKFRQKRKERCFDKKIRYVNRKKLAERRPRLRGQFVRKVNGVNVDLNGQPASADDDEEDEEDQQIACGSCHSGVVKLVNIAGKELDFL